MDLILSQDTRKVTTISLPSTPGSLVEMYEEANVGTIRSLQSIHDNFEKAIRLMIAQIKDWNLANEVDGKLVKKEITIENVDKMPQGDIKLMLATSQGITVEELDARAQEFIAGGIKKNTAGESQK